MGEKDMIEIGRLKAELPIPYVSILDMSIDEAKNEHGELKIRFILKGNTAEESILGLHNQPIKVKTPEGNPIFSGVILDIQADGEAEYKEVTIGALSNSCKADIERNSRTFQDSGKTLSSVAKSVLSACGAKVTVKEDAAIPHIIYQNNETDWQFVNRIANQYGIPVFTDCRQDGILISLGALGFQSKELEQNALHKAEVKDLAELRRIQANADSGASAYSFGGNQYVTADLTIATGDAVGDEFVSGNHISVKKQLVENSVFLYKKTAVKSSCAEMTGTALVSSVITGTVLAVKENDIQVQFDVDSEALGSELWIPYESAISNSFYCMPDVGDKVFVYYENNGKIACLGSKHVNTGLPDFQTPKEKVLTANDKMIRFTPSAVHFTTTRKLHDTESEEEITVFMDDSQGIVITSGKEISIETMESITLSAMEAPMETVDTESAAEKFKSASEQGRAKYTADGGLTKIDLIEKTAAKIVKNAGKHVVDNIVETAQGLVFYDLWGNAGDSGNQGESQAAPEVFDTGTVTIFGKTFMELAVGDSIIVLSDSSIMFQSPEFEWLGFTKNSHEEQSKENKDWWDTLLDGVQLALDVMGMFPVFGFVPDLINAGISLARGDIAGALMSAVAAIPGVGDAVGAVKIVAKGAKLLQKFEKVIKVAKLIYAGANLIATYIRNKDDLIKLYKVIRDKKFDITNPKDWDLVITALSTAQSTADTAKDFHDAATESKKKKKAEGADSDSDSKKNKDDSDSDGKKEKAKETAEEAAAKAAEYEAAKKKAKEDAAKKEKDYEKAKKQAKEDAKKKEKDYEKAKKKAKEDAKKKEKDYEKAKKQAKEDAARKEKEYQEAKKKAKEDAEKKAKEQETHADDKEECTKAGEPVDMVTGSFLVETTDTILQDITGEFELKRTYQSVYANEDRMIGKHWFFNIETRICTKDGVYAVQLPDGHKEEFLRTETGFEQKHRGSKTYQLLETEELFLLKDNKHKQQLGYQKNGLISYIEDGNQNRTEFRYTGRHLTELELASGQMLHFTYHNGLLESITDVLGRVIRYDYRNGDLYTVTYSNGGVIRYDYNAEGYIRSITDQNENNFITNYYDKSGRVVRQICSNGEEYIYLYNERERTNTFITSSTGKEVQYQYDKSGRVVKQTFQDGTYEEADYDENSNIIYERDRKGNVTLRKYDEASHLLEETKSNGYQLSYEYDQEGRLTHQSDNVGAEAYYTYDNGGNVLSKKVRQDKDFWAVTSYAYDGSGRMTSITDPNGNTVHYQYNNRFSKPSSYTTPEGDTFRYTYDKAGRLMSVQDAFGRISYGYNSMNYRTLVEDNEGNCTRYVYDKLNNLIKIIYPNEYDCTTGEGAGVIYEYDEMDTFVRMTDALGNVFATPVNCDGRIIKEINPNTYDPLTEDGQGLVHEYDWDSLRTRTIFPDGGIQRMKYDVKGNLIKNIQPMEYHAETDDGDGYEYEYDSMDRLVLIRNPLGVVEKYFEYDISGKLVKEVGAKGYLENHLLEDYEGTEHIGTRYQYNLSGLRTEEREPVSIEDGTVYYKLTCYEYDKKGNLTAQVRYQDYQSEISAIGRVLRIQYQYDKNDRLIQVSDSLGACVQYRYNSNNKVVYERRKINDDTDMVTNYEYNSIGRVVSVNQLSGKNETGNVFAKTFYDYDKTGNVIRIKTPSGHEIRRAYDAAGQLITEWHKGADREIDNRIDYTYDKAGNVIKITDANGKSIFHEFDCMNRETKQTLKNGGSWVTKYDKNGRMRTRISPNEYAKYGEQANGWNYTYDVQGHMLSVSDVNGNTVSSYQYNQAGELIGERDALDHGIVTSYDFGGRKRKVWTSGNSTQEYEYDAAGNITGIVDGNQHKVQYALDEWGRVTQVHGADDSIEVFSYDYAGNVVSATDGNGNTTAYAYNVWNKLSRVTDATGLEEFYGYDCEGNMVSHQDRNGNQINLAYNMYGSITAKSAADKSVIQTYGYYKDGVLKQAVSQGMRYDYTYYGNGLLKEKSASGKTLLALEYDLNGNRIRQKDVTGKTTEYHYDVLDRLEEIYDNETRIASYEYCPDGMIKSVRAGAGLVTEYAYDADRNMIGIKTTLGDKEIVNNTYTYDGNGNRLSKCGLWGEITYAYDSRNQLIKANYPSHSEELFYDKAGNRTKRLANGMEEQYEYDERNHLSRQSLINPLDSIMQKVTEYTYDAQGNLLKDDKAQYTYDSFNRAVKAETADGQIQINRYDAEELRYETEENGRLVQFLYHEKEVTAETSEQEVIRYIRDENVLLASDSVQARTYYHYASDEKGSITHVIDDEQNVVNWYQYDAFGNVTECEERFDNRFRYCGQQWDQLTGQYYLRARYYNPVIARFTQEDTYRGDGLNLYAYCHNNPVTYWDPSGNMTKAECRKLQAQNNANNPDPRYHPDSYYSYKELRKQIADAELSRRNGGLEAHHLLEKQFAKLFGVSQSEIISVALTPESHRGSGGEKVIGAGTNIDKKINAELQKIMATNSASSTSGATAEQVWQAHRNVYESMGHEDWANAIYEAYVKPKGISY